MGGGICFCLFAGLVTGFVGRLPAVGFFGFGGVLPAGFGLTSFGEVLSTTVGFFPFPGTVFFGEFTIASGVSMFVEMVEVGGRSSVAIVKGVEVALKLYFV